MGFSDRLSDFLGSVRAPTGVDVASDTARLAGHALARVDQLNGLREVLTAIRGSEFDFTQFYIR